MTTARRFFRSLLIGYCRCMLPITFLAATMTDPLPVLTSWRRAKDLWLGLWRKPC